MPVACFVCVAAQDWHEDQVASEGRVEAATAELDRPTNLWRLSALAVTSSISCNDDGLDLTFNEHINDFNLEFYS